jgi:superfamily II DNA helicase RecQ
VFREQTVRKNIRYEVDSTYADDNFSVDRMAAYVKMQQTGYKKILVYVAHAADVDELSKKLGAWSYHGQLPKEAKAKTQLEFNTASSGTLVATASFNAGVDIPDIRLVLRFGHPDHPVTYLQESGRGGRDRLPCVATIVIGRGIPSFLDKQPPPARQVILDLVQRGQLLSGCLRIPIDRYIDGDTKRVRCRADEEPCSYCSSLDRNITLTPAA